MLLYIQTLHQIQVGEKAKVLKSILAYLILKYLKCVWEI